MTEERAVREIAECILEVTGSASGMVFVPRPEEDHERRRPDVTRASERLAWSARAGVDEGLKGYLAALRRGSAHR